MEFLKGTYYSEWDEGYAVVESECVVDLPRMRVVSFGARSIEVEGVVGDYDDIESIAENMTDEYIVIDGTEYTSCAWLRVGEVDDDRGNGIIEYGRPMTEYTLEATITTTVPYRVIAADEDEAKDKLVEWMGNSWDQVENDMSNYGTGGEILFEVADTQRATITTMEGEDAMRSLDIALGTEY